MKSAIIHRIVTVAVTLPLFFILVFLLPHYNHLSFNIVAIPASILGALEVAAFFRKRGIPVSRWVFPLLSSTLPIVAYLEIAGVVQPAFFSFWLMVLFILVLIRGVAVKKEKDLADVLQFIPSSLLVIIYPALFISYIVRLSGFENSSIIIIFFLSLPIASDIMAYLAGMLLGRSTRLKLPVSPNKSMVGFIAGFLSSIGVALLFNYFFPALLLGKTSYAVLLGAVIGLLTIIGDLSESALKRSAGIKDSGKVIPGRGGLLDSVDSWLLSAPVFYYFFEMIYG